MNTVSGESIMAISRAAVPVIAVMVAVLASITYVPVSIFFVPRLFAY